MVIEYVDKGVNIIREGIGTVRSLLTKLLAFLPWDEALSLYILFFAVSLYIAYLYVSKFTTTPFSPKNLFYLLILAVIIFLLLSYI